MNSSRLLLLAVLLAACGTRTDDAPQPAGSSAPEAGSSARDDLAEVSNYRLTMEKMDRYYQAQRNIALKVKGMSQAERDAMNVGNDANASPGTMTEKMEQNPVLSSALREAGISAREFATLTMAMMQSAMAAGVLQMRPNDNQDSLAREMKANMDNIRFLRENEAELTRKQTAFEAEMRQLGMSGQS